MDGYSLSPLTIAQVRRCEHKPHPEKLGEFTTHTDGVCITGVKLVGKVLKIKPTQGPLVVMLDDSTGSIAVLKYFRVRGEDGGDVTAEEEEEDAGDESIPMRPVPELSFSVGDYVVVRGRLLHLPQTHGKPATNFHIDAQYISPLPLGPTGQPNYNVITHHMLECIYVHCQRTLPRPPVPLRSVGRGGEEEELEGCDNEEDASVCFF